MRLLTVNRGMGVILLLLVLAVIVLNTGEPVQAQCNVRSDWETYTVTRGDTLHRIAQRFNTTILALVQGNCLLNANRIKVGQQLRIPPTEAGATSPPGVQEFTTGATFQAFQNGFMVWRADTGEIRAYVGGYMPSGTGELLTYSATQFGHLPVQEVMAPQGFFAPIMGFNRVWSNFSGVRQRLGWAIEKEKGYTMRMTISGGFNSFTLPSGQIVSGSGQWWTATRYDGGNATPVPTPAPNATAPAAQIVTFAAGPNPVSVGVLLNISWHIEGTQYALLTIWDGSTNSALRIWDFLPTTGSVSYPVPETSTSELRLVVEAANLTTVYPVNMWERKASRMLVVPVSNKLHSITTQAAFQQYNQGFMIWRADTGTIYVFGLGLGTYPQSSYEGLPDNSCTDLRPGFVCPISGFGRVWANYADVRKYLGWATGAEQAYQARIVTDGTRLVSITLPDGRTVIIENGSSWRF